MPEIRFPAPKVDPEVMEAAVENMRRAMTGYAESAAKGAALFAANLESFFRQAAVALASDRPICTCPWPHDELAKREWPHVPLSLARAYAEEYVLTGKRP
jgi:hypothetical protein